MTTTGRYREIAEVLIRHGWGVLTTAAGLGRETRSHPSPVSASVATSPNMLPEDLRRTLEDLGPTFVKLGQLLSTRPDMLPPAYISELVKLQNEAAPVNIDAIRQTIESELGAEPRDLFATFDERPLACASIGQVHRARSVDGAAVVVKVRRPGAVRMVNEDLEILRALADRAEQLWGPARSFGARALVREFSQTIRGELDYLREAHNAERFADDFRHSPDVSFPRVHRERTTSSVLTLEYVTGIRITDITALDAAGVNRADLARRGADLMLTMIFEHGFFHADPHPGNLFVQTDGSITLIDFGMVGELDRDLRDRCIGLLVALSHRDAAELTDALIDLAVSGGAADRDRLHVSLTSFVADYRDTSVRAIRFAHLASELLGILRSQRMQLPHEVALIFKVLIMMEGIGVQLDPDYDVMAVLTPFVSRLMQQRLSLTAVSQRALQASADAGALMIELPALLRRVLDRVDMSGIQVHLPAAELEPLLARAERIGDRVVAGLIAAALINGVGNLVAHGRRWRSWDVVLLRSGVTALGSLAGYLLWTSRHRQPRPPRP